MGKGFSFVGRQYHIKTDTKSYYIDLVFYNFVLKCFVLIDLKLGELTHQDIGQMDMYIRMFEDLHTPEELKAELEREIHFYKKQTRISAENSN